LGLEISNGSAQAFPEKGLFGRSAFPAANQSVLNVALEVGYHQSNATVAKFPM
jgi:hypothetical protein